MHAHSTRSGTVGHSANRLDPRTSAPPPNNEVSQYTPHGLLRTYGPEPRRITSGSTASTYSRPPKTTDQRPGPRTSSVVAECHERIYESSPAPRHECGGDAHECGHRGDRQQRVDARTIHRKVSDPDVGRSRPRAHHEHDQHQQHETDARADTDQRRHSSRDATARSLRCIAATRLAASPDVRTIGTISAIYGRSVIRHRSSSRWHS